MARTELQKSAQLSRSVFVGSPLGIVIFDRQLQIVEVNPAFCTCIGYTAEQLRTKLMIHDLAHPDDIASIREKVSLVVLEKEPNARIKIRIRKGNSDWIVAEFIFSLLHDTDNDNRYVIGMVEDITEEKRAWAALESSEKMHRLLAGDLLAAQETERRDIVLELHDSIGGNLGAIKYFLEKVKLHRQSDQAAWDTSLEKLDNLIVDTINEVQRLSTTLRPPGLDDIGIFAALKWLIRQHNGIYTDTTITLDCSVDEAVVSASLKIVLFRLVQEAINNAAKHSQAKHIEVSLHNSGDRVTLRIADDGIGFTSVDDSPDKTIGGVGLHNMQLRAKLSEGKMTIWTQAGKGTIIHAEWDSLKLDQEPVPS